MYAYSPVTFTPSGPGNGQHPHQLQQQMNLPSDASKNQSPYGGQPLPYQLPQQGTFSADASGNLPVDLATFQQQQAAAGYYLGNPQMALPPHMYMEYYRMGELLLLLLLSLV
jgi:hypothetical protein